MKIPPTVNVEASRSPVFTARVMPVGGGSRSRIFLFYMLYFDAPRKTSLDVYVCRYFNFIYNTLLAAMLTSRRIEFDLHV
jgi:hypothetical protein